MARTIIEDEGTSPAVRDSSGPALVVGLLLGIAVVVLAVLFFSGTWDDKTPAGTPGTGTGDGGASSAPSSQPSSQPSAQPSSTP